VGGRSHGPGWIPTPRPGSARRADLRDEGGERHPHRDAEGAGLDQVQAPLAALALADERLGLAQPLGELDLRQAGAAAGVEKALEEDLVDYFDGEKTP